MVRVLPLFHTAALVVFALTSSTQAQPAGAQAEVLFRQGRELLGAGKIAEACDAFEASQKLEAAVTTLLNLASCREKNGQLATAWGLFLNAERQTRAESDQATRALHDVAAGHAKALEAKVSTLTINVPEQSNLEGLAITRGSDAVERVMWNRSLPIDGGSYTISARAPGAASWSSSVKIASEGDKKVVTVPDLRTLGHDIQKSPIGQPPRDSSPKPSSSPTASTSPAGSAATAASSADTKPELSDSTSAAPRSHSKMVPILVGAGGLALLGGALGFELWGGSTYDDAKAELASQMRRDSLESSANTKHYVAQGMAAAGVGCVGVAVWLWLRGRDEPTSQTATARRFIVGPTGVAFGGSF